MADITHNDPLVTESKLTEFYNDIKPFLGCPAYVTQEGDEMYFSFNEKVVGRWTNNKPLYQKTVIFSPAVDISSTSWTNTPISRGDIEFIINIDGWYDSGTGFQSRPLMAFVDSNSAVVKLLSGRDEVTQDTISGVIFQYTKTTDSASTTIEQKPTHYSTDEQVVGTWIDGKPIYQKTFTYTGPDITMDTTNRVLEIANISTLNIDKIIKQIEGEARWGSSRNPIPLSYYAPDLTVFADFLYDRAHGLLVLRYCRSSGTMVIGDIVATITYTKTTD